MLISTAEVIQRCLTSSGIYTMVVGSETMVVGSENGLVCGGDTALSGKDVCSGV